MKYTTLNEIRKHCPCYPSWVKLLKSLGKTKADDEPISFKYLLDTLGWRDAVWCLRVMPYHEECLFRADVAELVLPIFEAKHPNDDRPRKAIAAARDYHVGKINKEQLEAAADAADASAADDAAVAYVTAYAAYATATAYAAVAYATAYAAAPAKIEKLFIQHFCSEVE